MLKGREWLAKPTVLPHEPGAARGPGGMRLQRARAAYRQGGVSRCAWRGCSRRSCGSGPTTAPLGSDLLAAAIVTIMLIPQSLAYAMLAGLPPYVGLYASILPLVGYALFGSSRALAVGPVAVVLLMTAAAVGKLAAARQPASTSLRRSRSPRSRACASCRSASRASASSPTS